MEKVQIFFLKSFASCKYVTWVKTVFFLISHIILSVPTKLLRLHYFKTSFLSLVVIKDMSLQSFKVA